MDGFDSETFEERTALPRSVIESACAEALERGLLEQAGQRWAPTPLGRRFLNDLQALFLPDGPRRRQGRHSEKITPEWLRLPVRWLQAALKSVMGPKQLYTPALADPKYATLRVVIEVTS